MHKIYYVLSSFTIIILILLVSVLSTTITKQHKTIRLMEKCLNYSDNILDNNEIWDKDGSDYMCDYLRLRTELDSTFLAGFHRYENR